MPLDNKAFGLAAGLLWGGALLIVMVVSGATGYASGFVSLISGIYPGAGATIIGSLFALAYGLIDGFVGGFVFAWLYNRLEKKV